MVDVYTSKHLVATKRISNWWQQVIDDGHLETRKALNNKPVKFVTAAKTAEAAPKYGTTPDKVVSMTAGGKDYVDDVSADESMEMKAHRPSNSSPLKKKPR